jgi:anaerobic ribonucleoside-triphosphate reductase activating protein
MNFASIRNFDVSNGIGIGIALYVQGCHFHCKNCFNQITWDFNGGKEWTSNIEDKFIELANNKYVDRVSILGGEPLTPENYDTVLSLCKKLSKKIWVYTGYTYETLCDREILNYIDILVDGKYVDELRDLNLAFRGSSNQRIIDVKASLDNNKVVLFNLKE